MGPAPRDNGSPVARLAWAMISAAMETAVSSGVGTEVEADRGVQESQLALRYTGFAQQVHTVVVGAAGTHRTDVAHPQTEREP